MWYEAAMLVETFDSIYAALRHASNVKIKLCFNSQTYIETPIDSTALQMFDVIKDHPLMEIAEVIHKTNDDDFYNIADWRREEYDKNAKYTVWGESDTLIPDDMFYILENIQINEAHLLTFSSRPMWDESWDIVTHTALQGNKPCRCDREHEEDCGELLDWPNKRACDCNRSDGCKENCMEVLSSPWRYKDYITQKQLNEFNDVDDIDIVKLNTYKIDGSLLCLSKNIPSPFIAPDMHFVREDTCAAMFFQLKQIPQYHVRNRLKGHNYWHPEKRTNTNATRNDEVFKQYADMSQQSMNEFLNKVQYEINN